MEAYTKNNFHKYTFCIFTEVSSDEIADLKTNYTSKSGSSYFFTPEGVYRKSNHWGRAANCKWRLKSLISNPSRTKIGFAKWTEFHAINEVDKLYFIEVDFENRTVLYNHKALSNDPSLFFRNAADTAKRVKEIRNLFENDKKLQFWETSLTFDELFKKVINQLVSTNLKILEIKNLL